MESITDCAFSWPISVLWLGNGSLIYCAGTYVGSIRPRFLYDFGQSYDPYGRTWSRE